MDDLVYKEESYKIIGACINVHKELGCGFLEPVYQEALSQQFEDEHIPYQKEKCLVIYFHGKPLNKQYTTDFVCFDKIIVELKAVKTITDDHRAQIINYLKATKFKLGLLVNFGEKSMKYERFINNY